MWGVCVRVRVLIPVHFSPPAFSSLVINRRKHAPESAHKMDCKVLDVALYPRDSSRDLQRQREGKEELWPHQKASEEM